MVVKRIFTQLHQQYYKLSARLCNPPCPFRIENHMATSGSKLWVPSQSFASFFCWRWGTVGPYSHGENLEIEFFDITTLEKQPASSLLEAENDGEPLQQDDTESHGDSKSTEYLGWNHRLFLSFSGICRGINRNNTQSRKRVNIASTAFRIRKSDENCHREHWKQ